MSDDLLFHALDLACIVDSQSLTIQETADLTRRFWQADSELLLPEFRDDYRRWLYDVLYWAGYLYDKVTIDAEFPALQEFSDGVLERETLVRDMFDMDLFFKTLYVRIVYLDSQDYVRMKLRTLLSAYGYRRRSPHLVRYIEQCLEFYHLRTSLRGNVTCDVSEIKLDDMVTFRCIS